MNNPLQGEIFDWNNRFPIDRWWRQKHKIAFNSPAHRESNFIDQLFEFYEDKEFDKILSIPEYKQGDWLIEQSKTEDQKILSLEEEAEKELNKFSEDFKFE